MRLYPETRYIEFPDYRPSMSGPLPDGGMFAIWFTPGKTDYAGLRFVKQMIDVVLMHHPEQPAPEITVAVSAPLESDHAAQEPKP